ESNGEITVGLKEKPSALVMVGDWVWHDSTLQPFALAASLKDVLLGPVRIARSRVPGFLGQEWPQLSAAGSMEANFKLDDFTLAPQAPRFLLELQGGLAQLNGRLQCAYGSRIMTLGVTDQSEDTWMPDPQAPTRYSTRDQGAERAALARLQRQ